MNLTELIFSIKSLDPTKATGLDGISPSVFKSSTEIVSPILLKLIIIRIITGHFPDSLKLAKLQPIYKGGDKDDPSNYRPISVLPVVSYIIEKHVTYLAFLINTICYTSLSPDFENTILVTLHCYI